MLNIQPLKHLTRLKKGNSCEMFACFLKFLQTHTKSVGELLEITPQQTTSLNVVWCGINFAIRLVVLLYEAEKWPRINMYKKTETKRPCVLAANRRVGWIEKERKRRSLSSSLQRIASTLLL